VTVTPSRTTLMLVSTAAFVIIVVGLKAANHIVAPVFLSVALVILFYPLRAKLERRMRPALASIIVLTAAIVLLVGMVLAIAVSIGQLAKLIPEYSSQLDDIAANIGSSLTSMGVGKDQSDAAVSSADVDKLVGVATSVLGSIVSVLTSLFFIITLIVFLAFDSARVARLADGVRAQRPQLVDALTSFTKGTRTYLGVSAVFGLIVAVIDTILLYALGVPGAFIWGVLAFVTNFIPNIGFVIGIIPPALIALLDGGPSLMIAVIVVYSVVNFVIQSLIQPRYVGEAVGLSTSLTFVSLLFWTWVLGPVGALLAVPMSLLFRAILVEADPDGGWRLPVITGRPDEQGAT
jgi:AI-2 transport protein TqsA